MISAGLLVLGLIIVMAGLSELRAPMMWGGALLFTVGYILGGKI